MEGYYAVYLGNDVAGKVQVIKQGLYYKILCHCIVPQESIYRLFAVSDKGRENIGVVMPEDGGYVLERKIPVKRLFGCERFLLSTRTEEDSGKYVPIFPEEPFSYIAHLENAFLEIRNGQPGIRLKEIPGAD